MSRKAVTIIVVCLLAVIAYTTTFIAVRLYADYADRRDTEIAKLKDEINKLEATRANHAANATLQKRRIEPVAKRNNPSDRLWLETERESLREFENARDAAQAEIDKRRTRLEKIR